MTAWNDFVKKIYHEGHAKDPNYQFKNALKDASKRKGEMGSSSSSSSGSSGKTAKKSRKGRKKGTGTKKGGRRRRRR